MLARILFILTFDVSVRVSNWQIASKLGTLYTLGISTISQALIIPTEKLTGTQMSQIIKAREFWADEKVDYQSL